MITVLLADDEPAVRMVVERILRSAGFEVLAAEDGLDACTQAEQHAGGIDVLISDIVMPRVGGVELAKQLQALRPETKVLLISGYCPDGLEFSAGWRFLRKPFSPGVLTKAVEGLLKAS